MIVIMMVSPRGSAGSGLVVDTTEALDMWPCGFPRPEQLKLVVHEPARYSVQGLELYWFSLSNVAHVGRFPQVDMDSLSLDGWTYYNNIF